MKKLIVDLKEIINTEKIYYAHIKENSRLEETLEEHSNLAMNYAFKIIEKKGMDKILNKFLEKFLNGYNVEGKELGKELFINTIYLHDVGKIVPEFQRKKMKVDILEGTKDKRLGSKHSIVSSIIYIDYFMKKIEKIEKLEFNKEEEILGRKLRQKDKKRIRKEKIEKLYLLLYMNAYVISRHHSKLDSFNDFINLFYSDNDGTAYKVIDILSNDDFGILKEKINLKISEGRYSQIEKSKDTMENLEEEEKIYLYTYERLLYSILLAADFYATSEFMNGIKIEDFGCIEDIEEFYKIYKDTSVYKSIRGYEKKKYREEKDLENEENINVLRTEMFLDAEIALKENGEIYYLEAPTGAGKSNVGINLSFKLVKENKNISKIYYVYPFNTLIEQNEKNLGKIFNENKDVLNKIVTVNSLNSIKVDEQLSFKDEFNKYSKALLDRQFLNYPFILTTHVSIFNTMFGKEKEEAFSFFQLANSVILLDEIQSYKISIWAEIISFLKVFAKLLNIKIIIMSATLPNLEVLTDLKGETVRLIKNREKYFNNKIFKDRVEVDYSLLEESDSLINHIKEKSKGKKKILVEFISKKSAYEMYERLKEEELGSEIYLLTGDDNAIDRGNIIERVMDKEGNRENNIILIATQVIEAGVDIDMDIGYKDISKLDSEEQFMGRINRSCKRRGEVYFFNLDSETGIYKKDVRTRKSLILENDEIKDILINKNFEEYYSKVLDLLKKESSSTDSDKNLNEFIKEVGLLNFEKVSERMKLINEDNASISLYLGRKILDGDGKEIDGNKVWREYIQLLKDKGMEYSKKKVKLSEIKAKMNYFIYQVKKNSNLVYTEIVGEIYYIEDGDKYFKDGRVDKEKIITGIGDFI